MSQSCINNCVKNALPWWVSGAVTIAIAVWLLAAASAIGIPVLGPALAAFLFVIGAGFLIVFLIGLIACAVKCSKG